MTAPERAVASTRAQPAGAPGVRAEEFRLVRPSAVSRARALLDGERWAADDVVAAVAAQLLDDGTV